MEISAELRKKHSYFCERLKKDSEEVILKKNHFLSGIVAGCEVRCHARPAFRQVPSHHLLVMSECQG